MENNKKNLRFLVTAIGSMAADTVIKSLRKNFPNSIIIGTDTHEKEWLYLSDKVDVFYRVPKANDLKFISSVNSILKKHKINFILPLTDPEVDVLSTSRQQLLSHITKLTLPDDRIVRVCRNKERFVVELERISEINLINSYSREDIINKKYKLPLVRKPKMGRSSEGLLFIKSKSLISNFDDNYIYQPHIKGDIITVDIVRDYSGNIISLPRRELIRTSNGAGLSVKIFSCDKIHKLVRKITESLNITGCMNIEFIESGGEYYVLDINPRFSAGVGFSTIYGYDFILNHIRVYQNKEVLPISYKENIIAVKHFTDYVIA